MVIFEIFIFKSFLNLLDAFVSIIGKIIKFFKKLNLLFLIKRYLLFFLIILNSKYLLFFIFFKTKSFFKKDLQLFMRGHSVQLGFLGLHMRAPNSINA